MSSSQSKSVSQKLAGLLAGSFLLGNGRRLFEENCRNYNLPLSKLQKLLAGGYIILRDHADGKFPPTFEDQARAYQAEIDFYDSMAGSTKEQNLDAHRRKPFWGPVAWGKYSASFTRLLAAFESLPLKPGARLLELGCGCGWMSEFLALSGYNVVGTTIMPDDIALGEERARALKQRGLTELLAFRTSPMESVHDAAKDLGPYDCAFVFEALHHAFDWRAAIESASRSLKPGGWLLLANEPNLLHTYVSYRIARLSNTHEIGMSRKLLVAQMQKCGLSNVRVMAPKWNNLVSEHWIAAQRVS